MVGGLGGVKAGFRVRGGYVWLASRRCSALDSFVSS